MPQNVEIVKDSSTKGETKASKIGALEGNGVLMDTDTAPEVTKPSYDLTKFQLKRILQNNTLRKTIALLGTFPALSTSDEAVLLLEKQAFKESDVQTDCEDDADGKRQFFNDALQVRTEFINNIYGSFQCVPSTELNGIKTTVVYPATEKHIEKYSITQKFLINETPKLYAQLTLPYITDSQFSLDWVYNILEHREEVDRIVYEDPDPETGYVLLPDLKWDGKTVETLYLLAIVHARGLKSLRDLNGSHLPLLRNLRDGIAAAVEARYGLCGSQLRMYFHYQPSFYHLHLHINPVRGDAPGIWCEKSHMLETVINNLELLPDYYERATLPFVLFEGNKLLDQYEAEKAVRKEAIISKCETSEKTAKTATARDSEAIESAEDEPQAKRVKVTAD